MYWHILVRAQGIGNSDILINLRFNSLYFNLTRHSSRRQSSYRFEFPMKLGCARDLNSGEPQTHWHLHNLIITESPPRAERGSLEESESEMIIGSWRLEV